MLTPPTPQPQPGGHLVKDPSSILFFETRAPPPPTREAVHPRTVSFHTPAAEQQAAGMEEEEEEEDGPIKGGRCM